MTEDNQRVLRGKCRGGKLTKTELVAVGRTLRDKALAGDVHAALALSNYALVDAINKQPAQALAA